MTSLDLYAALIAPVSDEHSEQTDVPNERSSQLSFTNFQEIKTFLHLDTLGNLIPWLR